MAVWLRRCAVVLRRSTSIWGLLVGPGKPAQDGDTRVEILVPREGMPAQAQGEIELEMGLNSEVLERLPLNLEAKGFYDPPHLAPTARSMKNERTNWEPGDMPGNSVMFPSVPKP